MKILKKLLATLVVAAVLFAVVGFFLPRTAHVERSIAIDAPPSMVFTVLNGFKQFSRWSPWADIDPNATTTLEGPPAGVGAKMSWAGNAEVGTGSQEILESTPYSQIKVRLAFGDFPGAFIASYALAPEGEGTQVTWAFDADYGSSIMGRYFGLLSDSMLGPDYERGLGRLKNFVEGLPKADFAGLVVETTEAEAQPLLLMPVRTANDPNAIGVALGVAYGRLSGYISAQGLEQAGPPVAIHNGEQGGALSLDAAIPVNRTDVAVAAPIRAGSSYAGRVLKVVHTGDYAGLPAAREKVRAYLATAGLEQVGPLWEQYASDPGSTPPAELVTNIFVPIK
jgi:effector-binding domain-containing protein